jgi:sugar phosphate isomerase/epimerase
LVSRAMTNAILDRVSYHAVYDASVMDALEYARDNGFAGIQLEAESPHLDFERLSAPEVKTIASFVASEGIFVSIHAPDAAVSLFQHSSHLREGLMNYYRALFDFASSAGAQMVTIHIGEMTTFRTDTRREFTVPEADQSIYRETVTRNLNELLGMAAGRCTVCVQSYTSMNSASSS